MQRMTSAAKPLVDAEWNTQCRSSSGGLYIGVPLIPTGSGEFVECPFDLRKSERKLRNSLVVTEDGHYRFFIAFFMDQRHFVREQAMYNLFVTGFICILLCGASMVFTHDARKLVLLPL